MPPAFARSISNSATAPPPLPRLPSRARALPHLSCPFGLRNCLSPSEPPRTLAARVSSGLPEPAAAAVTRLALAEERARYAARPAGSAQLRRDGTTARRGLAATARRSTRWRAALFPASIITALTEAAARIPDHTTALKPQHRTHRARP